MPKLINDIICNVSELGLSETFYYGFFFLGFLVTYCFLIWYGRKIEIKTAKVIVSVALGSVLVLCVMKVLQIILNPIANVVPIMNTFLNNMGRGFVFVPLIGIIVSAIVREPWVKICNLYSFTQTIIWGIASLGCLFAGCCKGYPCEWGIINSTTGTRLFPTQIINSFALLSIAAYIYTRCKKRDFKIDGKEYPIVLICVGALRFATEFLMDNPKIILGLSSLSIDSIVMFAVGLAIYTVVDKKSKQRDEGRVIPNGGKLCAEECKK